MKKIFADIFSPYFCAGCFQFINYGYLCGKCLSDNEFSLGIFCIECGKRRPFNEELSKTCCSTMLKSLISFVNYENEVIAKLIKLGKFGGYFEIFNFFGYLIAKELRAIKKNLEEFYLVPIPLFKTDELKRGFNQSKILAESIKNNLGIEISECLVKTKSNKPQRVLAEKEREKNIKGVFEIKIQPPKKIILIDDVKTTGATLLEAVKVLKENGAKTIVGLTIAK